MPTAFQANTISFTEQFNGSAYGLFGYTPTVGDTYMIIKNDGTDAMKQSATFKQVPGLAAAKAASLESVAAPGRYVLVSGGQLALQAAASAADKLAATFAIEKTDVE